MSPDTVVKWRPTGRFRTNGRPVLEKVVVKKTTPEENMPPNFLPEELEITTEPGGKNDPRRFESSLGLHINPIEMKKVFKAAGEPKKGAKDD